MKATTWFIAMAIFAAATFITASQQGHAYIQNTFLFVHRTIFTIIFLFGFVISAYQVWKNTNH